MASGLSQPPSPPQPKQGRVLTCEQYIETQLRKTSAGVKAVDIAFSLMLLLVATLGFFVLMAVVDHWLVPGGLGGLGRTIFFTLYLGGALAYIVLRLVPVLLGRINPAFAAHTIENSAPTLKNSLLNFLSFRGQQRGEVPEPIYHALEQQAASRLSTVPVELAIDRTKILRVGYVLMALAVVCALYKVLSPKDPLVTVQRILLPWADILPPSRVKIEEIKPGSTSAVRGEQVTVSAQIRGIRADEAAQLIYSTDDGQAVDRVLPMFASKGGDTFTCDLPESESGLQEGLIYRIEAGDAVSHPYRLDVITAPTIALKTVYYKYPKYTKLVDRNYLRNGNLRAIEGTQVTLRVETNAEIKQAWVDFENDRRRDLQMTHKGTEAWVSFPLELDKERRGAKHTSYSFRFTSAEGRSNQDPVEYQIEVIPDLAPEIVFLQPEPSERETEVPLDGTLLIETSAIDPDFALAQVELRGEVKGEEVFLHSLLKKSHAGQFVSKYELVPSREQLKAGDVVEYWAVAVDNKSPEANRTETERYRFTVIAPENPEDQLAQNDPRQNPDPQNNPDQKNNPDQQPMPEAGKPDQPEKQDPNQREPAGGQQNPDQKQEPDQQKPKEGEQGDQGEPQADGKKPEDGQPVQGGEPGDSQDGEGSQEDSKPGEKGEKGGAGQPGTGSESSDDADEPDGENDAPGQPGKEGTQGKNSEKPASEQNSNDSEQSGEPNADGQPGDGSKSQGKPSANSSEPADQRPQEVSQDDEGTVFDRLHKALKEQEEQERANQEKSDEPGDRKQSEKNPSADKQPGQEKTGEKPEGENTSSEQQPDGQQQGTRKQGEDPSGREPKAGEKPTGDNPDGSSEENPGQQGSGEEKGTEKGEEKGTEQQPNQDPMGDPSQDSPSAGEGTDEKQTGKKPESGDASSPKADPSKKQQPGDTPKQDKGNGPGGEKPEPGAKADQETNQQPGGKQEDPAAGEDPNEGKQTGDQQQEGAGGKAKPGQEKSEEMKDPQDPSADGSKPMSGEGQTEKGDGGAGKPMGDDPAGTPDAQNQPKPQDKPSKPGDEKKSEEDAKSPGHATSENDSQGEEGGDKAGGGKKGGGQHAPRHGTGSDGQNTAAEEGSGKSNESGGNGQKSDKGGDKTEAEQPPESEGQKKAGEGRKKRPDEQAPGEKRPGEGQQPSEGEQSSESGEAGKQGSNEGRPGESGDPMGNKPSSQNNPPPSSQGEAPVADDANLDYTRKATDLVLEYLEDQLKQDELSSEVQEQLPGWTKEDIQSLVDRTRTRQEAAKGQGAESEQAQKELKDWLRSLGLKKNNSRGISQNARETQDTTSGLRQSRGSRAPAEYADQVEAYKKGLSKQKP